MPWVIATPANIMQHANVVLYLQPNLRSGVLHVPLFYCFPKLIQNRFTIWPFWQNVLKVCYLCQQKEDWSIKVSQYKDIASVLHTGGMQRQQADYQTFPIASKHTSQNSRDLSHTAPMNHCSFSPPTCRNTCWLTTIAKSIEVLYLPLAPS